ncbi:MAG: DUF4157 domain-containing protein [Cyanobacteriota bacterium]
MTHQPVSRTNQQSKSDTPLVSGVLQRAAVRNVPEKEVEPTQEVEATTFRESRFHHNFSQVPASTGEMPMIQPKLKIGAVGDRYEQEADRVAQDVVQRINAPAALQRRELIAPSIRSLESQPGGFGAEKLMPKVQRREAIAGGEASTDLASAINRARGSGQPLEAGLQQTMGQAMGADFGGVRVHTDVQSDLLNRTIQAKAFTTGQDVFFRQGAYQPASRGGQELIAHELTHVVQQNGEKQNIQNRSEVLREEDNEQDSQLSNLPLIIQKKAYIGDNYQDINEEVDEPENKELTIAKDDITRRFSDVSEFKKFARTPKDPSIDHIGEMPDDHSWIRVDQFTVLGEDHGKQKAPSIIAAIGTKRYRYEGFIDMGKEVWQDSKFLESEADNRAKRFEKLRLAQDEGIHEAEGVIPKYARVMPDAIAVISEQRGKPIAQNKRTTKPYGEIKINDAYDENYNFDEAIVIALKGALIYTRSLGKQKNNPFGKFYIENTAAIDSCIKELERALLARRVPDFTKNVFPLTRKKLTSLKDIFVKEAKKELSMDSNSVIEEWKQSLAVYEATDQQYTEEAKEIDFMRDASMFQTIKESKGKKDLLFIIGDDHRKKLKPILQKNNIKVTSDNDFISQQQTFNKDAQQGEEKYTDKMKQVETSAEKSTNRYFLRNIKAKPRVGQKISLTELPAGGLWMLNGEIINGEKPEFILTNEPSTITAVRKNKKGEFVKCWEKSIKGQE